ncbi:hypothetical protein LCGC14_1971840 [marine sediment metagenome]|uniref:Uncharacterized protein n=1 Tax=marine sediment metagenome TaxID=412755 RepID=A0A0F9HPV4_9ZZZZ
MDIAAAKKRCEAATPEPWRAGYEDGSAPDTVMTVAKHQCQTKVGVRVESGKTERGRFVSFTKDDGVPPLTFPPMPNILCEIDDDLPEAERLANAEFIAHARTDLPIALEALEEAQGSCERQQHLSRIANLAEQLAEAQGKVEELERLTYDLHQRSGHPDSACLRCQFYAILRGTKEDE